MITICQGRDTSDALQLCGTSSEQPSVVPPFMVQTRAVVAVEI
jgi:hypothetical protein